MNKKIITTLVILTSLMFLPISAKADYPSGTLGYSDDIAVGNEYTWTVKTLDLSGDFSDYTSYATIGGEDLSKGSKIKVVVTDDPDTAIGDWYEIYLDSELLPSADFGSLLDYGMYYASGNFFINPVTYTNATGTYGIYEQILEEVVDQNEDNSDSDSTEYSGYTYSYSYSEKIEFAIKGDVFSVVMYEYEGMSLKGGGYDIEQHIEIRVETTININTGLIGKTEYMVDVSLGMSTTSTIAGTMHILIDSGYANTPFSWAFSFLGLIVFAAVVGLVKRKR